MAHLGLELVLANTTRLRPESERGLEGVMPRGRPCCEPEETERREGARFKADLGS